MIPMNIYIHVLNKNTASGMKYRYYFSECTEINVARPVTHTFTICQYNDRLQITIKKKLDQVKQRKWWYYRQFLAYLPRTHVISLISQLLQGMICDSSLQMQYYFRLLRKADSDGGTLIIRSNLHQCPTVLVIHGKSQTKTEGNQ